MRKPLTEKEEKDLRAFFSEGTREMKEIVCCVVTEALDPDWHHLDDDSANNNLGNIIPLSRKLNSNLGTIKLRNRVEPDEYLEPDLQVVDLLRKADMWADRWLFARAYACARLAFYCSRPPYSNRGTEEVLIIGCKAIRYLRHRVSYPILDKTLEDILNVLKLLKEVRVPALIGLEYDLAALLNEHGEHERAAECAKKILSWWEAYKKHNLNVDKAGSILRRVVSVAQINPQNVETGDWSLEDMVQELAHMADISNLRLRASIANTQVLAALAAGTMPELVKAYDEIAPLCDEFARHIKPKKRSGILKIRIGLSDLAEIFYYRAVLAVILKPSMDSEDRVREWCELSTILFRHCHALLTNQRPDFWTELFKGLGINPFSDNHPLAEVFREFRREPLPKPTSELVKRIFQVTSRIRVI